ncbi:hypothetical protein [Mesorhizobium silamurunense]|uniref:hypothetical protein n=1 Tax=Mesorhizobium silamurunense TaxID=499528 RepID=UPI00177C71D2|nr:hypothetical protein [Mesorhizobium silamurunense]
MAVTDFVSMMRNPIRSTEEIVWSGWVDTGRDRRRGYASRCGAYLYLMQNEFMTGETIHIDGGQRLI